MPQSTMRLIWAKTRVERLLQSQVRSERPSFRRVLRMLQLRQSIAVKLSRAGFPTPIL
jgi:hypothetical protein